ncbi:MAG: hypothetical protein LBI69_05295 [Puniceicoccales bacterium]|jgi:tyrosine-specific transport protein|nr:hypothetical protein [Puniceicoccales bacterium]
MEGAASEIFLRGSDVAMNMRSRQRGAIFMVAGTCIGGGTIALPMMLAGIGLFLTIFLMLGIWALMYYSALINVELNLQAGKGMDIGSLGYRFGGKWSACIGKLTLATLMYALLAAYFHGLTSIVSGIFSLQDSQCMWARVGISAFIYGVLVLPIHRLDRFNRLLFMAMILSGGMILVGLMGKGVSWQPSLLLPASEWSWGCFWGIIPVIFTSFGFQVIFHTLSDYCAMDRRILRRVFFFGSLIPAIVYILWTACVLWAIRSNDQNFYGAMVRGGVDVGKLIERLSRIPSLAYMHIAVWVLALCSIVTSMFGVGMGLCDSIQAFLSNSSSNPLKSRPAAACIALAPPLLLGMAVPHAFTMILGFAGIILALLAFVLPLHLLRVGKFISYHYPILANGFLRVLCLVAIVFVIACEVCHLVR